MHRRLLGTEAGNLSAVHRFWRLGQRIIQFLRRLFCRGAGKPPSDEALPIYLSSPPSDFQIPIYSNPDDNHFIDIGIDDLVLHGRIPEKSVTLVDNDDVADYELPPVDQRKSKIDQHVLESLIYDVAITKAETTECGVSFATDNLSPAEERPIYRRLGPYSSDQKILLVGEGDFSFSASLAVAFDDASNMIATSLDSFAFLVKNYKRATSNIEKLTNRGCKVILGVDATQMVSYLPLGSLKFDCIVFNFPHAGFANRQAPRDAQISEHQELVRGFMANAKTMIKSDGEIHITHKCRGFFLEWNLEMLGSTQGLRLVEESHFNFRDYPGYCTKYGYGGDRNFNCNPSKRYKFKLAS